MITDHNGPFGIFSYGHNFFSSESELHENVFTIECQYYYQTDGFCPFKFSSFSSQHSHQSSKHKTEHLLEKLQKVQNSAARLVLKAHKRDHVSTLLRTLHWLPVQAHIEYKLSTLYHSIFSNTAPFYLSDLLRVYSPSRQLRSFSDSRTLRIPHIKTKTFGHRSFSHAAPSVWNSLPHEIRHIQSATAFKTALKTHLFKSYLC